MSNEEQFAILANARDSAQDIRRNQANDLRGLSESQAWFEGYTHGMWESGLITEIEKDYIIEKISEIFQYCCTDDSVSTS